MEVPVFIDLSFARRKALWRVWDRMGQFFKHCTARGHLATLFQASGMGRAGSNSETS